MSSTIKITFKLLKGRDILFVGSYSEFKDLLNYHLGIKSKHSKFKEYLKDMINKGATPFDEDYYINILPKNLSVKISSTIEETISPLEEIFSKMIEDKTDLELLNEEFFNDLVKYTYNKYKEDYFKYDFLETMDYYKGLYFINKYKLIPLDFKHFVYTSNQGKDTTPTFLMEKYYFLTVDNNDFLIERISGQGETLVSFYPLEEVTEQILGKKEIEFLLKLSNITKEVKK